MSIAIGEPEVLISRQQVTLWRSRCSSQWRDTVVTVPLFAEEPVPVSNRRGRCKKMGGNRSGWWRSSVPGLRQIPPSMQCPPGRPCCWTASAHHGAVFVYDTLICGPRRRLSSSASLWRAVRAGRQLERAAVDKLCHYRYCHGIRSGGFAGGHELVCGLRSVDQQT